MTSQLKNKKRLMFITGQDYYFLVYNILLILHGYNCTKGKYFKSHRKLVHLIDIVADSKYINILKRGADGLKLSTTDINALEERYSFSHCRLNEITKLLLGLERREIVVLRKSKNNLCLDVSLVNDKALFTFLKSKIFEEERKNLDKFKTVFKRVQGLKLSTFVDNVFTKQGVKAWLN